jgi:hypothetical protein
MKDMRWYMGDVLRMDKLESLTYYENICYREKINNLNEKFSLDLCGSNISDVSNLCLVHTLNLSKCNYISDVSSLGSVHTLDLSGCKNVSDVSSLGSVHTLTLEYCENITDVSMLSSVHRLDLVGCKNITDIGYLINVKKLKIDRKVYGLYLLKNLGELSMPESKKSYMKGEIKKLKRLNKKVVVNFV